MGIIIKIKIRTINFNSRSRYNTVSMATGYGLEGRGSIPGRGKKFFSTPHSLQCKEYRGPFPRG
jgi:hypothetical protein